MALTAEAVVLVWFGWFWFGVRLGFGLVWLVGVCGFGLVGFGVLWFQLNQKDSWIYRGI